jgi:hypothetical protein
MSMPISKILPTITSILVNGFIGFVFFVFLGAGAGNSNSGKFFMSVLLPIEISVFSLLCFISIIFIIKNSLYPRSFLVQRFPH